MSRTNATIFECDLCKGTENTPIGTSIPDGWIIASCQGPSGVKRVYDICYRCARIIHNASTEAKLSFMETPE